MAGINDSMHVPRLYTPENLADGEELRISGQAAHHAANVLRLTAGAAILVFDGRGHEHRASITAVNRSDIQLAVHEAVSTRMESCLDITLMQGIARNDHMDLILQKAVELGVNTIQPLWMQRSQTHLKKERLAKRIKHWGQSSLTPANSAAGRPCRGCRPYRISQTGSIQHDWQARALCFSLKAMR